MAFKPKKSYTESDAREQQSIDFINGLLKGTSAYPELRYGEKGANIDGYIQLLDENKCIGLGPYSEGAISDMFLYFLYF